MHCKVWTTNEGSHTYGYWRGSLTGRQNEPGLNENTEFDNNTCGLDPISILDTVIPYNFSHRPEIQHTLIQRMSNELL
jgi:hypothetical protein